MPSDYRDNHYVPQWYQRRFIPAGRSDKKLFYLDLTPGTYERNGIETEYRAVTYRACKKCFFETDLYTEQFGATESVDIERFFFGSIDDSCARAAGYFEDFRHPSMDNRAFRSLVRYMSVQKLRTRKGLAWLRDATRAKSKNELLRRMRELVDLFAAVWSESIWQIADATNSPTKFIVSDHPVTVYNRAIPPERIPDKDDPEIRMHGTHTLFPLSLNKVLILTNLSWLRNPYQSATDMRPNPVLFRDAMFRWQQIQTCRELTEREVREINYIVKRRAYRYLAAGEEEWLYPERELESTTWAELGDGLLLMPDPRSAGFYGEVIIGGYDGRSTAWDEYGFRPGQVGFADRSRADEERRTFYRFVAEFARRIGPQRRGRAMHVVSLDPECDSDEVHENHMSYETEYHRIIGI